MDELNDFYNDGTGWTCRHCTRKMNGTVSPGRTFREGEAESKSPDLANAGLAKWLDKTRRQLICPRCGIVEAVEKF